MSDRRKKRPGRPVECPMPGPIPDTPENVMNGRLVEQHHSPDHGP